MKKIFTTKISLQSSNPTYSYPIVRLPRTLKDLAGETVTIYQTERDGSLAFFVVPKLDNLDKFIEGMGQEDQERLGAPIDQKKPTTNGLGGFEPDLRHVKTGNSALEQAFLISQHFFFGCAARPDNNKEGKHNHDGPIYSLRSQ